MGKDLYRNSTNGSSVPLGCDLIDPSVVNSVCPSNKWQAIKTFLEFTTSLTKSYSQLEIPYATFPPSVEVTGQNSLRRLIIAMQDSDSSGYDPNIAIATTQQAAVADALSATGVLWNLAVSDVSTKGHGHPEDQLDAVHSIAQDYYQPYTVASCQSDVIDGLDDRRPVAFPLPPSSDPSMLNASAYDDSILLGYRMSPSTATLSPGHAFKYPGITRSEILNTSGPPWENRLRWVELPNDPFNGTAIGAVVLLPKTEDDKAQQIIVCNLGAGWGTSTMNTSTFSATPQTVLSEVDAEVPKGVELFNVPTPKAEGDVLNDNAYFYLPVFPERTVTVTEEWANFLNPSLSSMNTTLFHHLMTSNITSIQVTTNVKLILAGLLANGLSSIGSTSKLQGTIKTVKGPDGSSSINGNYWFSGKGNIFEVNPSDSADWVKLRVSSVFQGYAYNTDGTSQKLAISVLLLYCASALAHIIYAGFSGISSTCWDSIAEVTALAVNSPPTRALRNTCAGITELDIFKLPVRILTMRDEEGDGEHLELVFGNVDEKSVEHRIIRPNRTYGTLPSMKPWEKTQ